jgi:hypothetical protein
MCRLSDAIVFSAAVPGQGGVSHLNEQWPAYWAELFHGEGFECFDVFRDQLWEISDVAFWYRQNMLLFLRTGTAMYETITGTTDSVRRPRSLVHPIALERVRSENEYLRGRTWPRRLESALRRLGLQRKRSQ